MVAVANVNRTAATADGNSGASGIEPFKVEGDVVAFAVGEFVVV